MDDFSSRPSAGAPEQPIVTVTLPPQGPQPPVPQPAQPRLRWRVSIGLFIATCLSTYLVGGPVFAAALMTILTAHELGHFFQARRYGVPASLPYFIPMPLTPIGTMGAVIAMQPQVAPKKALFDLAITGPLAGLFPALLASYYGLGMSQIIEPEKTENVISLGEPLVFKFMSHMVFGQLPEGQDVLLHPLAFAGWVGIFITGLNLLPIGQLDGGHILFTLLPHRAYYSISLFLLAGAVVTVVVQGLWEWSLMLLLLFLVAYHPPTAPGPSRLDPGRVVLGWLTLLFVIFGFTPTPFIL